LRTLAGKTSWMHTRVLSVGDAPTFALPGQPTSPFLPEIL